MPAKNCLKQYLTNGYYHLYNRGVEKRKIFQEEIDYKVFLSYLKEYLNPKQIDKLRLLIEKTCYDQRDKLFKTIQMNNYANKIKLLAYCLMPNHFHLLVQQKNERGIEEFMRSMGTRYVMYFNKKYKRTGGLFQGRYKAVLVRTDEQLWHLSRYIHSNPPYKGLTLLEYPYSSLGAYLGEWKAAWLKTNLILSHFSPKSSYKAFFEGILQKEDDEIVEKLKIE